MKESKHFYDVFGHITLQLRTGIYRQLFKSRKHIFKYYVSLMLTHNRNYYLQANPGSI